jgi:hypothetical protein
LLLSLIFFLREKTGLVRKDLLDCMIELRNRAKGMVQDKTESAKNLKNHLEFGKLNITVIIREG